ncbi:MAG: hypothetical protein IPN29_02595 [Saprospiraceae bacterium]|nr:hypothetical protein [Saprospiraceae bacterium]
MRLNYRLNTDFVEKIIGAKLISVQTEKGIINISDCKKIGVSNPLKLILQKSNKEFILFELQFPQKIYEIEVDYEIKPLISISTKHPGICEHCNLALHFSEPSIVEVNILYRRIEMKEKHVEFYYSVVFDLGYSKHLIFVWSDVPNTLEIYKDDGTIYEILKDDENWL